MYRKSFAVKISDLKVKDLKFLIVFLFNTLISLMALKVSRFGYYIFIPKPIIDEFDLGGSKIKLQLDINGVGHFFITNIIALPVITIFAFIVSMFVWIPIKVMLFLFVVFMYSFMAIKHYQYRNKLEYISEYQDNAFCSIQLHKIKVFWDNYESEYDIWLKENFGNDSDNES